MTSEMRCADCVEIGCECPRGYLSGLQHCRICKLRAAVSYPLCVKAVPCPNCGSDMEEALEEA